MNLTAFRKITKIKSNVLQNSCRLFSYKFEMTPAIRNTSETLEDKTTMPVAVEENQQVTAPPIRYNVCQPRKSSLQRPSTAGDIIATQRQIVKAAIEEQHLQPSMLPKYYQTQMDRNVLVHPQPDPNEGDRINNSHNNPNRFQVSKTYANASLPLKSVKLASPFPEPVKTMMSRTVADDEKAEQMLAESRSQRGTTSDWGRIPFGVPPTRAFSTTIQRWYSSKKGGSTVSANADKCKKLNKRREGGCPKMRLAGCPPPARQKCDRIPIDVKCTKQEAPYPAYSEFCHEDIEEKPSECKLCPWKPEENPNYKVKQHKKEYHTSAPLAMRRTGLEVEDWDNYSRKLGEYEEVTVQNEDVIMPNEEVKMQSEEVEGMQCDLRKPPCERPKNQRCPAKKVEKPKIEKKKKKPQKECSEGASMSESLLENPEILPFPEEEKIISLKKKDGRGGPCKVKKFKFPRCEPIKRKREERNQDGCPAKKKKPLVPDCPPDEESRCQDGSAVVGNIGYSLSRKKKDKTKCPKLDFTLNKPEEEDDDPCNLKRRGTTRICPGDLLKKKSRKPRQKKTSAIITPTDTKKEPIAPQPTIRT